MKTRRLLAFDPSPHQQEMLEHINRMRMNPQGELAVLFTSLSPLTARDPGAQDAIQQYRDPTGDKIRRESANLAPVQPLAWRAALVRAATGHSEKMIQHDTQSHQLPGEPSLGTRISNAGYNYSAVGENIYAFADGIFHAHSGFAIDWGVDDRGHRTNILNPNYREFGAGILNDFSSATDVGEWIVTQSFGARKSQSNSHLLGVVYQNRYDHSWYDAYEGLPGVFVEVSGPSGTFTTTTLTAGGYQIAVPPGTYTATISSGGILPARTRAGVTVAAANVKVIPTDESFDADGDGRTDILWRSSAAGATILWTMNGAVSQQARPLGGNLAWKVIGASDLNGDGYGDLLWRESASGSTVQHSMVAGRVTEAKPIGGDRQWSVAGTWRLGEFLNTVITAVAWRHGPTGLTTMRSTLDDTSTVVGGSSAWKLLGRPGLM